MPAIQSHLLRFRPVLERRREVQIDRIRWWHLHWPRQESLFIHPRILAVQMGSYPRFVHVERPAYVGFSVNVIQAKSPHALSLRALTAVLNSHTAREWFETHAKHRGVHLDISGTVLRRFPLPAADAEAAATLDRLARKMHKLAAQSDTASQVATLDSAIDSLVRKLYAIPPE